MSNAVRSSQTTALQHTSTYTTIGFRDMPLYMWEKCGTQYVLKRSKKSVDKLLESPQAKDMTPSQIADVAYPWSTLYRDWIVANYKILNALNPNITYNDAVELSSSERWLSILHEVITSNAGK